MEILHYPDPRLRLPSKPVTEVTPELQQQLREMLTLMYDAPGVGLAAPQVNIQLRMVVIDVSEAKDTPLFFINPEIVEKSGSCSGDEGCLSVPGIWEQVKRAEWVKVQALDIEGKPFTTEAEGLLAICIQHEIDHLNGILFVDHLSRLKQMRLRKKIEKAERKRGID
ncbi:MAG: peptide deformylase [Gammaproteobacteria bacterium]|nr:peptide deformylase [Gammaproteobacteria bacterium]